MFLNFLCLKLFIYKIIIIIMPIYRVIGGSLIALLVKNLPAMQETRVQFLGWEDPLEKEMATHSSILAWRIPQTEEPGRLQSMGSQESEHNLVTKSPSPELLLRENGTLHVNYLQELILKMKIFLKFILVLI